MLESYRSYLRSSEPGQLGMLVLVLIVAGSFIPFGDFVAAPLLIYAGRQIRAQHSPDRTTRLIAATAASMGLVMGVLAVWSLLSVAELFVPTSLG